MIWDYFIGEIKESLIFCNENKKGNEKINSNTYIIILNLYLLLFEHIICELTGRIAVF